MAPSGACGLRLREIVPDYGRASPRLLEAKGTPPPSVRALHPGRSVTCVIVDDLRSTEIDGDIERSARVRWRGGEHRLTIQVPAQFALPPEDASPFLAASLVSAMRRHEELHVDGAVSARLLRRLRNIQSTHMLWDPTLAPCDVRVAATIDEPAKGSGTGALFTRGVDSTFTAIGGGDPEFSPIEHLIFSPTFQEAWDAELRAEQLTRTREAAALLGRPLISVETNIRAMTDLAVDWDDAIVGGLALIALSLGGGLSRVIVAATFAHFTHGPHGSHPLLDPLYSTESVQIEHDATDQTRFAKVAHIVAECPEMLPHLKVCWAQSRPDNCGRCSKCLLTMAYLEARGALRATPAFAAELDLDLLSKTPQYPAWRMDAVECCRSLDPATQGPLRAALIDMIRRSARPTPRQRATAAIAALRGDREHRDPRWSNDSSATMRNFVNVPLAILWEGRPYPPLERRIDPLSLGGSVSVGAIEPAAAATPRDPGLIGLVRVLDRPAGRHVYGAGEIPAPLRPPPPNQPDRRVLAGELGSLRACAGNGRTALWLTSDGRAVTARTPPAPRRPGPLRAARWVAAPAMWPGRSSPRALAAALLRRAAALPAVYRPAPTPSGAPADAEPAGYLESAPGDGLIALYSALHPVTGDQLLSNDPAEARDLGYSEPVLLGHLVAQSQVTEALGTIRPRIEWASRFGLYASAEVPP